MVGAATCDMLAFGKRRVCCFDRSGVYGKGLGAPQYVPKKSAEAPFDVWIPETLKDVAFMLKDGKRFPDTGGWGYGMFHFDAASGAFTPDGTGAQCGAACHTIVKAKDFVFTAYGTR
jgi:hypothetical protein